MVLIEWSFIYKRESFNFWSFSDFQSIFKLDSCLKLLTLIESYHILDNRPKSIYCSFAKESLDSYDLVFEFWVESA